MQNEGEWIDEKCVTVSEPKVAQIPSWKQGNIWLLIHGNPDELYFNNEQFDFWRKSFIFLLVRVNDLINNRTMRP